MWGDRTNIAHGIGGLAPIPVYDRYTQSLQPGHAFLKWNGRTRDDSGLGWIDSWQVWVALSQDVATAEEWMDIHLDELIAAADTELVVTSVDPAELILGASQSNGLIITGTRSAA